jgi:hypothetical protein
MEFSWTDFFIGFLVGLLITVFLVWITYANRWFIFDNCSRASQTCTTNDYYNQPCEALSNSNLTASEILFVNSNGKLEYKRVPKNRNCTPGPDQSTSISVPEYCLFTENGQSYVAKTSQTNTNNNVYTTSNGLSFNASVNCKALDSGVVGEPLEMWDPC